MESILHDIDSNVDTFVYIEPDRNDQQQSDANDNEDFHVCRKCNKVFKCLPEYLEHKIKYENYRISQTRSKIDRRIVLPQLVHRQKKKVKSEAVTTSPDQVVDSLSESHSAASSCQLGKANSPLPAPETGICTQKYVQKTKLVVPDIAEMKLASPSQIHRKRGRKKRSEALEDSLDTSREPLQDVTYLCSVCHKTFRREATLRWHVKKEHFECKEVSKDESRQVFVSCGKIKKPDNERRELNIHDTTEDNQKAEAERRTSVLLSVSTSEGGVGEEEHIDSNQPNNQLRIHVSTESEAERPFACEICGHQFRDVWVLKAHWTVHSNERKFVCTVENCPYGFKTKGGLVRHMRRHTGERPFACDQCGRAFAESGALSRHMKSRRNCAQMPDSAYPQYLKNWTYHPNIPAVINPALRDIHQGRSLLQQPVSPPAEIHFVISDVAESTEITAEILKTEEGSGDTLEWKSDAAVKPILTSTSGLVVAQDATTVQASIFEILDTKSELSSSHHSKIEPPQQAELVELEARTDTQCAGKTQCQVCLKDMANIEALEIHLKSHLADQQARCSLCHFLSLSREELRQHMLSMHYNSLSDVELNVLSLEQSEGREITMPQNIHTTRDALVAVKQLYSLKKHHSPTVVKSCPTVSGSLQCMVCNRVLKSSGYLRQHMRTHTGDRQHQCSVCHRKFTSRDILKKHLYVHKEERDFKCGQCGKLFKRLAHVQQHLRIHSVERCYRCSLCQNLFKSQNSLSVHMRTHSGVNPYKCHVCGRHFRERGSLHRHMRMHTGEKPYQCHLCHRSFAEHGTLARHLKARVPCCSSLKKVTWPGQDLDNSSNNQVKEEVLDSQQQAEIWAVSQQFNIQTVPEVTEDCWVVDKSALQSEETANSGSVKKEESQEIETLQIYDPDTIETVIIVAEPSIVARIQEEQLSLEAGQSEINLQKIKDILQMVEGVTCIMGDSTSCTLGPEEIFLSQQPANSDQTKPSDSISGPGAEPLNTSEQK